MTTFDQRNQQVETQYNAGRDINVYQHPLSLTETQRKQNRTRMLDRVQTIWVSGVLEHSLHGAAQLAPGLREQQGAIANPWRLVLQELDQSGPLLPADARIGQVYNLANGEVLILGEPGAGKSILLLELARDLLERARRDEAHPIPVVFNLSSWATRRQPLSDWLVSELTSKYQIPHMLAASWIETDQVLPLLDGLDEVVVLHRAACVEAINTYRQAHGLLPTVVCCRQVDYEMLLTSVRLQLRTAVVVQPLTPQQIETYLANGGEQLGALRWTLHEDADLHTLARTPLMLNVLTVAYQGTPHKEVAITGSLEAKQEQIFATYVQRMLARRSISTHFTSAQTIHWLSWLAQQMKRHNQTEFYIERMQPDWLPKSRLRRLSYDDFVRLGVVLLSGLVVGLIYGLLDGLLYGLPSKLLGKINITQINGLRDGLITGLIFGLLFGLTSRVKTEIKPAEVIIWSWGSMWRRLGRIKFLRNGSIGGLIMGSLLGLLTGVNDGLDNGVISGLITGLISGLIFGLIFGLIVGFVSLLPSRMPDKHPPITARQGKWRFARNSVLVGLIVGLADGLILGVGLYSDLVVAVVYGLTGGLVVALLVALVVALIGRLSSGVPDRHPLIVLLRGQRHPMRNGMLVGLLIGLLSGLVRGLLVGLSYGLARGLVVWLVKGMAIGLFVGLLFALLGRLIGKLSSGMPDRHPPITPDQGQRHSRHSSMLVGLVIGLLSALIFGLLGGWIGGLVAGVVIGLISGAVGGFLGILSSEILDMYRPVGLGVGLVKGLVIGLIFGFLNGLVDGLLFGYGLVDGLLYGLIFGLLGWLVGWLAIGLTSRPETEMRSVRVSMWQRLVQIESLRNVLGYGLTTVLSGLFYGFDLITCLLGGLVAGLVGWLFFGLLSWLIGGLSSEKLDEHTLVSPNQGIRNSARNSVLVGLIFGLATGLVAGLVTGLFFSIDGLVVGLIFGLFFGLSIATISALSVGLPNGGVACIQHAILRLLLWRSEYIPWNYPQFLDYAAERILLRKVGGGYIFLHRLLLNYFADLETGSISNEAVESRNNILSPRATPSAPMEPIGADGLSGVPTAPLSLAPSDGSRLLPCGHEQRPNARFCSVCGASAPS